VPYIQPLDSLSSVQPPQGAAPDSVDPSVVTTFAERLEQSFSLLGEFVPALFGALVILFAGYLVAKVLEKGTQRLLRRLHFNQMLERGGVMQAVERSGSHLNPVRVIANVLFWFVMFAVLLIAANAIGMESLANVFSELVSYIPSVIAAIVIIILGIVLGGFVGGLIMASAGGLHGGPWLARIGRGGVIVLAIFMALQELGIATDIVTTAFAILFGAVALALALSFGLGNRDLAGEVTREWYARYRAERLAIEAEAAAEEAEELAEEAQELAEEASEGGARERSGEKAGVVSRFARFGAMLLVAALAGNASLQAQAQTQATTPASPPKRAGTPGGAAVTAADRAALAFLAADEEFFDRKVKTQRAQYLSRAGWAELGDRCNPGSLRVFPRDTSSVQQDSLQRLVESMESTIIARGVGARLDTPEARALLRVLVGWEAGIDRPRWDSDDAVNRRAVAAGLTGETPDPRGGACLPSPMARDTVTFVIPGFSDMAFPKAPRPRVKAYFGKDAAKRARDEFFTAVGSSNPALELTYVHVAPVLHWRSWALVTVNRPRERAGVDLGSGGNGGATYLLRRVEGEWRLLSIVRSWGS
jgi:hypothetical protein